MIPGLFLFHISLKPWKPLVNINIQTVNGSHGYLASVFVQNNSKRIIVPYSWNQIPMNLFMQILVCFWRHSYAFRFCTGFLHFFYCFPDIIFCHSESPTFPSFSYNCNRNIDNIISKISRTSSTFFLRVSTFIDNYPFVNRSAHSNFTYHVFLTLSRLIVLSRK